MRTVSLALVLTVAALALAAGCLTTPPAQPSTGGTTTTTSTPTPDATTPTPTPEPTHPGGGMLIRPAHEENASQDFRLVGDESASGFYPPGSVTFSFVGKNEGAAAEALADPCGAGNPKMWIEDENGTKLELSPPQVRCMAAMGFVPFASGATIERNLTWNGTAYHGDQAYTAPPGLYHAIGVFEAKRDGTIVDVQVSLPFSIVSERGVL